MAKQKKQAAKMSFFQGKNALDQIAQILSHTYLPLILGLLSLALLLPSIFGGFQMDDHFQRIRLLDKEKSAMDLFIFYDGDVDRNLSNMESGRLPWWAAFNLRHASFRYLSTLTMMLDYKLWPDNPILMHLHSLLWLAVLVFSVTLLYRQVFGPVWVAGLAALLYAIDDAHALPTAYIANRYGLIASCFGTLCILFFARWRSDGWRPGAILSPICLGLAMAAGEIALATAGYLLAFSLFIDKGGIFKRLSSLGFHGLILAAWAVIYKIGNFGVEGVGFYQDPRANPIEFINIFFQRAPILILGQWTPIPSDLGSVIVPGSEMGYLLSSIAILVIVLVGILFLMLLRQNRVARFWLLGALLSLVPIAATGPQNRLLFFVGIGSMALVSQMVQYAFSETVWHKSWAARKFVRGACVVLLVMHLLLAPFGCLYFIKSQKTSSLAMISALESIPSDKEIAHQDLVLVNPPDYVYLVQAIFPYQSLSKRLQPRRILALAQGNTDIKVIRVNAKTLELHLEKGLFPDPFNRYFRSSSLAFSKGDRIDLEGFSIKILGMNNMGDPDIIQYQFTKPLEDKGLRWMVFKEGTYHAWIPPRIGETSMILAEKGIFG